MRVRGGICYCKFNHLLLEFSIILQVCYLSLVYRKRIVYIIITYTISHHSLIYYRWDLAYPYFIIHL